MKNQKHTVRKVIDYIEEHLEEELNLEQIAEHAGYSRFHLNRIFMEETGGTIHKFKQVYLCPPGAYRKRGIYQPAKKRMQMHQASCFTVYGVCDRMGGIAA